MSGRREAVEVLVRAAVLAIKMLFSYPLAEQERFHSITIVHTPRTAHRTLRAISTRIPKESPAPALASRERRRAGTHPHANALQILEGIYFGKCASNERQRNGEWKEKIMTIERHLSTV